TSYRSSVYIPGFRIESKNRSEESEDNRIYTRYCKDLPRCRLTHRPDHLRTQQWSWYCNENVESSAPITSLVDAYVLPIFYQIEYGLVIFALDACRLSCEYSYVVNAAMGSLLCEPFPLLTCHFLYRYFAIAKKNAVDHYFDEALLVDYGIDLQLPDAPRMINLNYLHSRGGPWNENVLLSAGITTCAVITTQIIDGFCARQILRKLDNFVFRKSKRALQLQLNLFRTLIVQLSMPALFCTVPFSVLTLLPLTGRSFGIAANIIGMTVPLIPATDPFLVLLSMPTFRKILSGWRKRIGWRWIDVNTITVLISLLENILLIAVVLHKKCRVLGTYRCLLISFAFVGMAISIDIACVLPVFVKIEYGILVFYLDTFKMPNCNDFLLNAISTCLYFSTFPLLTFHFIYRYLALAKPGFVSKNLVTSALFAVLFNLMLACIIVYNNWLLIQPSRSFFRFHFTHSNGSWNWNSLLSLVISAIDLNVTLVINVICAFRTARIFDKLAPSDRYKHHQVQLFRALIVQFSIPFLLYAPPFAFLIFAPLAGRSFGQTANVVGLIVSTYPAFHLVLLHLMGCSRNETESGVLAPLYHMRFRNAAPHFTFLWHVSLSRWNVGQTSNIIGMIIAFYPAIDPYCVLLILPNLSNAHPSSYPPGSCNSLPVVVLYTSATLSLIGNSILIFVVLHPKCRILGTYRLGWLLMSFAAMDIIVSLVHAYVLPVFVQVEYGLIVFSMDTYRLPSFYCFLHKSDRTTFSMLAEYDMDLRTADAPRMIYLNYLHSLNGSWNEYAIGAAGINALAIFITLLVNLYCGWRIVRALHDLCALGESENAKTHSEHSKRRQLQLFRSLVVQYSFGQAANLFGIQVSVFPAIDPFLILFILPKFRRIRGCWFRQCKTSNTVSVTETSL
uniref:G protein-coupled receptor n=1 Tax=Pristionchus pacificus TaxID=54126 RepID=A0A8R1Y6R2_PRIPA